MKSDYSARRLLTNHPEQSIVPLRLAMLTATELQHRAQDYKHSVDMPGGLPWDGETARAVQDTAASDEKTIYLATQVLLDDAPKALVTLEFQSIEYRREAVDLYNEASDHGYTVAEDLTVSWNMQPDASAEVIEKANQSAAKFTRVMRKAYDKWWAAELEAQQQIDAICDELAASFNPFCGLTPAQGNRDGEHFQADSQRDQSVLSRVNAASLLDDRQLKDLAAGKSVTIPSNQLQYLYEFAQSFDGKSATEIAAIKAALPEESRDAMTRAFDLVSNNQVKSGVPFTDGALKNFIPDVGSEPRLPDGIVSETIHLPPVEPTDAEKFLRAVNQQYGDESVHRSV
ncbi:MULTISPECIES: hypothetical protein [Mycobacteroides]|jgi:hypothetical protein|uniref:TPR repeat domain-containing protein n=1 Tax=Mycobacteroides chelonae TaxID=1774 RepID=A0A1S1LPF6_MYCCH|nr:MULTISPECIES: hypothetical protein [Mycobacteroides]KRQ26906.1 hypothetical protein AOT87_02660 [Mycobacteroides sp. H003]KRQ28761.1 hypothetical protein AOT91_18310 [Mycobacteroides sp. H092]KRQ44175.1 hypothetical protein AOT92_07610 [Mycobacteroides sp. H101]KRQ51043.1 hypothetical protein AOT88_06555 [Mycobacteroides sp. H063]KRQ57508.1 hypothetical protein AOT94_16205 [Mycobacteroides sp. HXVII]